MKEEANEDKLFTGTMALDVLKRPILKACETTRRPEERVVLLFLLIARSAEIYGALTARKNTSPSTGVSFEEVEVDGDLKVETFLFRPVRITVILVT